MMIFSVSVVNLAVYGNDGPAVFVEPKNSVFSTAEKRVGDTIQINCTVANVTGLAGFGFRLSWDPNLLICTDIQEILFHTVTPTEFWSNIWNIKLKYNNTEGTADYATTWQDVYQAVVDGYAPANITTNEYPEGKLAVAIITLSIVSEPFPGGFKECSLDLSDTRIGDIDGNLIVHTVNNGYYKLTGSAARARFTWYPDVPDENTTVTFDASSSESFNGTIVSYEWEFGDNGTATGVTVDHVYSERGNYTVTLNITDSNGLSDLVMHLIVIRVAVHDVAVVIFAVDPYYGRTIYGVGCDLAIAVRVANQGEVQETFNVSIFANSTVVLIQQVIDLAPSSDSLLWPMYCSTSDLSIGTYVMRAEATFLPEETDTADNTYVGETITLQSPVHDIAIVHTECAHYALPGSNVPIQVTIANRGNIRETFNITVYANETAVDTVTVVMDLGWFDDSGLVWPFETDFTLTWNSTGFALETYLITVVASPVTGETNIVDNTATIGTVTLLYSDHAIFYIYPQYVHVAPNETFTVDLCIFNVANMAGWQTEINYNTSVLTCLNAGPRPGGPAGSVWCTGFPWNQPTGSFTLYHLQFKAIGEGTSYLHFSGFPWTAISDPYANPIPYSVLDGSIDVYLHDLSLTSGNLSKTIIGKGYCADYTVKAYNNGLCPEDFNITFYANATAFQQQAVFGLNQTCSTEMICSLNTTTLGYGNHTLSATAGPMPGETRLSDNTVYGGTFIVTIPGDVNGDFQVDIYDAIKLAGAYNTSPTSANWNANIDINGENVVDIYDAIILANHYGQHYP